MHARARTCAHPVCAPAYFWPQALQMTKLSKDTLVPTSQEDHLEEDDPITGQRYVCMSFISPHDVQPRKDTFFFHKYLDEVFKPKIASFVEAVKQTPSCVEQFTASLNEDIASVGNDVDAFLNNNLERLEATFSAEYPLQLTTSGFKVRGSYPNLKTARNRAEHLQRCDPNMDVFVAQVGAWCPFHPSAESVGDVVYDETELNTMMKLKKEAEDARSKAYAEMKSNAVTKSKDSNLTTIQEADSDASADE